MRTILTVLASLILVAAACAAEQRNLTETEKDLVAAINVERTSHHLSPLVVDPQLQAAARQHGAWMATNQSMIHSRYPYAENIAMGYPSIAAVVAGWMHSPGHRASILGGYRTTGASIYRASNGTLYWCQEFTR